MCGSAKANRPISPGVYISEENLVDICPLIYEASAEHSILSSDGQFSTSDADKNLHINYISGGASDCQRERFSCVFGLHGKLYVHP